MTPTNNYKEFPANKGPVEKKVFSFFVKAFDSRLKEKKEHDSRNRHS